MIWVRRRLLIFLILPGAPTSSWYRCELKTRTLSSSHRHKDRGYLSEVFRKANLNYTSLTFCLLIYLLFFVPLQPILQLLRIFFLQPLKNCCIVVFNYFLFRIHQKLNLFCQPVNKRHLQNHLHLVLLIHFLLVLHVMEKSLLNVQYVLSLLHDPDLHFSLENFQPLWTYQWSWFLWKVYQNCPNWLCQRFCRFWKKLRKLFNQLGRLWTKILDEFCMKVLVIVFWKKSMEEHHGSVKCHVNSVIHEFHAIQFEEIEEVESLKIDPESEMSHNFSEKFLFNKIDDHIQLTDFKWDVEMLKELKKVPTLIVPLKLVVDFLGHLFFVEGEVLVGD